MKLERVRIPVPEGELAGLVYHPSQTPHPECVIVSHGFTASKESVDLLASYLAGRGYLCVAFDFRGHKLGASQGQMCSVADGLEDVKSTMHWALDHLACSRCVLAGHSMGALMSLVVAAENPFVAAVVAIATGLRPSRSFQTIVGQAMLKQRADYIAGADPFQLVDELDTLATRIDGLSGRPALFVAAQGDVLVKATRMKAMAEAAGPLGRYVEIEGTHLEAPSRARGAVARWLDEVFGHRTRREP